jgi:hypothetical protein
MLSKTTATKHGRVLADRHHGTRFISRIRVVFFGSKTMSCVTAWSESLQRAARHAGNAAVQAIIVRGILEDLTSFPSEAASSVSAGGAVYSEPPLLQFGQGDGMLEVHGVNGKLTTRPAERSSGTDAPPGDGGGGITDTPPRESGNGD